MQAAQIALYATRRDTKAKGREQWAGWKKDAAAAEAANSQSVSPSPLKVLVCGPCPIQDLIINYPLHVDIIAE